MVTKRKSYKEYPARYIGSSDCAFLTVSAPKGCTRLFFGEDGSYKAYIVDGNAEIGTHYNKVFTANTWIKIFDDEELTFSADAKEINIYQAGMRGCIIQLIQPKVKRK